MQDNPLVTILTPVYNSPDLFQTLESVRMQSYRPIQYILVDDASECFEETRIREFFSQVGDGFTLVVLRNEQNAGTVRTMNRGLSLAQGKYVFNLAGDDAFFDENVIRDWVAAFEQIDSDVLAARRAICDEKLDKIRDILPSKKTMRVMEGLSPSKLYEYLSWQNYIYGCCTAWRLESLRRLGLYDEHYRLVEDYPAYLQLIRDGGTISFLDRVVIRYRGGGVCETAGEVFEQDRVQILQREIVPYVRYPYMMKFHFKHWQRGVHLDRWYNRQLEINSNSKSRFFLLHCVHCIDFFYHPRKTIRTIKRLLRKTKDQGAL